MKITAEQAADILIAQAPKHGIDASTLDRAAIVAQFAEVFARKVREQAEATPEQIANHFAQRVAQHDDPDLDELIRRGEV